MTSRILNAIALINLCSIMSCNPLKSDCPAYGYTDNSKCHKEDKGEVEGARFQLMVLGNGKVQRVSGEQFFFKNKNEVDYIIQVQSTTHRYSLIDRNLTIYWQTKACANNDHDCLNDIDFTLSLSDNKNKLTSEFNDVYEKIP